MLDFQEVARNNAQIDRVLSEATATTEAYLHRGFFPWQGTRKFDWPNRNNPVSYRFRLDDHELISLTSVTCGTSTFNTANVLLYPQSGPPYNWLETLISGTNVFQAGNTWQNALVVTGLWGYQNATRIVGTLAATITSSQTTLVVSDSSQVGVGNVILVDSEYMVVRDQLNVTTSQTLQTPMTASAANTSVAVTSGAAFAAGEAITLDTEQMLVVDVAGNTLTVKRAWNGTVLATHTGSTIYAPRTLVVDRNACVGAGIASTAAAHTAGVNINLHIIHPAVEALTLAEAGWLYMNHAAAWQTAPGSTNRMTTQQAGLDVLTDLRTRVMRSAGRKGRQKGI
jgi:hypothetical protein